MVLENVLKSGHKFDRHEKINTCSNQVKNTGNNNLRIEEQVNMKSPINKNIPSRYHTQNPYVNEIPQAKQNSYRKNSLSITSLAQNNNNNSLRNSINKNAASRERSNSLSKPRNNKNNKVSKMPLGSSPAKNNPEIKSLSLTPNQIKNKGGEDVMDVRKHLSNYYDSKKQALKENE
jgi:hypothetical protein